MKLVMAVTATMHNSLQNCNIVGLMLFKLEVKCLCYIDRTLCCFWWLPNVSVLLCYL